MGRNQIRSEFTQIRSDSYHSARNVWGRVKVAMGAERLQIWQTLVLDRGNEEIRCV